MSENQQNLPCIPENYDLEASVEAMIFMSKEPITLEQIVDHFAALDIKISSGQVKKVLHQLEALWDEKDRAIGRGLMLRKLASGYLFTTAQQQSHVAKTMVLSKPLELSKTHLEVLSIIAYRQPITRVEVDEIRGVESSFAIKRLMQLKLLKILGKSEGLGRPLLYGTTKHFLEFFALNSLNDLPTLKQFESLGTALENEKEDKSQDNINFVDLFTDQKASAMFSEDTERASEEALKSLDDALLRIDEAAKAQ